MIFAFGPTNISMWIVGTIVNINFKTLKPFTLQFLRKFPLRLEGLHECILIKDETKRKPLAQRQTLFWIILITPCTLAKFSAFVPPPPPNIWTEDNSMTFSREANLPGEAWDSRFNPGFNVWTICWTNEEIEWVCEWIFPPYLNLIIWQTLHHEVKINEPCHNTSPVMEYRFIIVIIQNMNCHFDFSWFLRVLIGSLKCQVKQVYGLVI